MNREACLRGYADEIANFAAEELSNYLKKYKDTFKAPKIVIDRESAKKHFPEQYNELKPDGFVIGWHDDTVIIGAENDLGLLYGVYDYVEHAIGIRFVERPFNETDTEIRNPAWPPHVIVENPSFKYRGGCMHYSKDDWNFCYNIDRLGKSRLNNVLLFPHQLELMKKHISEYRKRGVRVTMGGHCWPQLFYDFGEISHEEMMKNHPEWHAIVDGKRLTCEDSTGMFCLSNKDAVDHFVKNALKMIDDYSDCIDVLSLWPNDTYSLFCECEECRKLRYSDLVLRLINRIADEVAEKYPYMQIEMLAYDDFNAPPLETIPSQNVIVNFAAIMRDYRIPFYSVDRRNIAFMRDLRGWRALREDLDMIVYEYYRLDGIPKSSVIQYEFERFREAGMIGVMEDTFQDNISNDFKAKSGILGFMSYLEYKLMWNIDQSADELLRELVNTLFGKKAPAVWSILRRAEQLQAGTPYYNLLWHDWRIRPIRNVEVQDNRLDFMVEELQDLLRIAEEALQDSDGVLYERLDKIKSLVSNLLNSMSNFSYQIKAQLIFMKNGSIDEANALIKCALDALGREPAQLTGETLAAYCKAYSDLPESTVCMLKSLDIKDRVARVPIIKNCEHICENFKKSGRCMHCNTPMCIDAIKLTPLRDFV